MRSVFELEAGDLVSRLETKNLATFQNLEEAQAESLRKSLPMCMFYVYLGLLSVFVRH